MPIYEYRCESCKQVFEELIFSSDEKPSCPKCSSDSTHRILSPVSWKGEGGGGSASGCTSCSPGPSGCKGCSK
ncbi:MAG: zinc ribbon domain-containing protein [Pseudomonadota bacterium]